MSKYKSYLDELHEKDRLKEQKTQESIKTHKCHACEWSTWTGIKYYCMFPRCIKGDIKNVDKETS